MTTRRQQLRERARGVDWLRVIQRGAVFFREARGDTHEQIESDHQRELQRSKRLRETIEAFFSSKGPTR